MSLTTKQKEALQALADVMQEHDIAFMATVLNHETYMTNPFFYIGEYGTVLAIKNNKRYTNYE